MAPEQHKKTTGSKSSEAHAKPASRGDLILPLTIVSKADVSKCARELDLVEEFFRQAAIRGGGEARAVPKLNAKLEGLARDNNLNLLRAEDRAELKAFLARLKAKAPVVHMSFAGEASSDFKKSLLKWFREQAHPYTVLHIGMQPEIAAGCTLRTTNKVFDFSLRRRFDKSKDKLIAALEAVK